MKTVLEKDAILKTNLSGSDRVNKKAIIKNVLMYIEENLHEDISLDRIAEELHYSKFHINRLFAKEVGRTIHKYIQSRRLTEAARLLVDTDLPIVEIAQEAHYNSQQAFTLAFHQVFLCTPRVYRQKGVFLPRQDRITMSSVQTGSGFYMMGGRMAA